MQRWGDNGGGYRRGGNMVNRGGNQSGSWRDPNAMDVDRGKGEIGHVITAESRAIWPGIVGRKIEQE